MFFPILIASFMISTWLFSISIPSYAEEEYPLSISDIHIRDPFIYPHQETKTYYLYASTQNRLGESGTGLGVEVYRSQDLQHWSNPVLVFRKEKDFWGGNEIWAPEMHRVDDWFYLFVTFNGREGGRGTQILRAKDPEGPFLPVSNEANTPPEQCCLDGTPWVDETGQHWLVYCHEWIQIQDGTMRVIPMQKDFSQRTGESILLFHASDAPWVKALSGRPGNYVTDGPCLYRTQAGKLLMLWSSFTGDGSTYAIGIAESESGQITGPWKHHEKPLFNQDGGHCTLFRTFAGQLTLVLHQPNGGNQERAHFFPIVEENGELKLTQ